MKNAETMTAAERRAETAARLAKLPPIERKPAAPAPAKVTRLQYAGPEEMSKAPARKPRPAKAAPEGNAPETETAAAPIGPTGADFPGMAYTEQAALVSACVCNAFKLIEERSGRPFIEMERDHGDDARQEAFALCLEWADDPERAAAPLALFASKAAGKAAAAMVYAGAKAAGPEVETERTPNAEHIEGPEAAAIRREFLPRALDVIADDKTRAHAAALCALVMAGYSVTEAAEAVGISSRLAYFVLDAVKAAADFIRAVDGEKAALDRVALSDARTLASLDRRARAAAVAVSRRTPAPRPDFAPVIEWTEERRAPALIEWGHMSYMERIAAAAVNREFVLELFRLG